MAKQTFTVGQILTSAQMTSLQATAMGGGAATAKTASYVLVAADAGTTVAMNAAGATTITVNTGLFAAGDTVFIQNLGAGACTVTAGTATVATAGSLILPQNDAGILYFTATGTAIFYDYIQAGAVSPLTTKGDLYGFSTSDARVPIGANGTILTADSTESLGLKWAAPAGGASFVGANVYKNVTQSIANATWTTITFDSENFDTDSFHSTSTNTSRMTIPSGKNGKYLVTANLSFPTNTTGMRASMIRKNGADYAKGTWIGAFNEAVGLIATQIIDLVATDYVEMQVYQDSGGSLNIQYESVSSQFSITYLGA